MHIVEVKNNLIKINHEPAQEELALADFIFVKSPTHAFIGQVIFLEANEKGTFAVTKLLFNFSSDGVVSSYNGVIPALDSELDIIPPQELLGILPIENPVIVGELAQKQTLLKLDRSLFEEKLLVCCENSSDKELLTNNITAQLKSHNKKVLIIDLDGSNEYSGEKIIAGENFRLPLNYETIDFIYSGLEDAKAETKALIQDIFLEVQEYVKTLPEKYIPFESFKNVVDSQYKETNLTELVLLKNKLLKYYEKGVFAQEKAEFASLQNSLNNTETTVLDLSQMDEKIQKEMISFAYSTIKNSEIYVIVSVNDANSNKKLLKQIVTSKAYPTIICNYSYKYVKELKQVSKNLMLFAPIQQQTDFASYNTFLGKLNPHEFVIYGQATQYMPLIIKLDATPQETFEEIIEAQEPELIPEPTAEELTLDEEIRRDVDGIFLAPRREPEISEEQPEETLPEQILTEENLTEDDLDFIEENLLEEEIDITEFQQTPESPEEQEEDSIFNELIEEPVQTQEFIEKSEEAEILPVEAAAVPVVPIYSAEVEAKDSSDEFEKGDIVSHPKYGKGTVEKLINYGSKTLCSIHFDNVGRRLLDPALAEIKKVNN